MIPQSILYQMSAYPKLDLCVIGAIIVYGIIEMS
jgi:hypothetical protein